MVSSLGATLGPVGGLAACACCLIIAAIWGLFATTIALAVYTKDWRDAIKRANNLSTSDGAQMFFSQALLIGILCLYGFIGLRRAMRSAE